MPGQRLNPQPFDLLPEELRIERALALYARGGMTFGAAAEQAGVTQSERARHVYAAGLDPPLTDATLLKAFNCEN